MIISDQEVSWAYLLGPCFQLQNTKGVPLTGGYIEVYIHGTRDKYYCASDFAGTLHPFQIPLDSLGSNIVLASTEQAYDVYVYNRFGSLIMSRYNVIPVNGTSEGGGGTSNISITSSDGTITVTDSLDPETGIKTYDLSVPWASGDASYWHSRGASNQGQLISDTDTHVLAISEHAIDHEGEDITVGSDGKFHLKEGVYFWTVNVDLYSDSLSNNTQQIYINSNINRASYNMDMTRDNQHSVSFSGITVASQDDFQEGFTIKTEGQPIRAAIYEVAIHKLNPKVLGTKYDAGYGIVIEDDTISVDPEVIPSVSTVSAMIQEAVTSIEPGEIYTAGEYIKIEDNEISVTGLQPAGDYLTSEDLEGYATESWVTSQGYITEVPEGYATETYVTTYVDNSVSSFTTEQEVTTLIQEAITAIAPEPELPLVAGDGITITEYEDRVEIAANVTSIDGYATESFVTGYVEQAISEIPEQEQADWDQTDDTQVDYIKNKPDLDIYATHDEVTSAVTSIDLSNYATNTEVYEATVTAVQVATGAIPEEEEIEFEEIDLNDYALASAIPDVSDYATHNEVYEATVTAVQVATGAIPDVSDYATHAEVYDTAVTAIQLVTGLIPDVSDFTTHTEVYEATVTAIESATAVIPDTEEVEFEEINLSDYALASAIPDVSDYATHDEVHESIVTAMEYVTGIIPEAQVQSNWTETDNEDPSYIQNKPDELPLVAGDGITITEDLDHITIAANVTSIDGYATIEEVNTVSSTIIETVNNVSSVLHEEIQNIPEQVQVDWDQTNVTAVDYIKNKPDEEEVEFEEVNLSDYALASAIPEYTAGNYINIDNYEINVTGLQPEGDYATHTDLIEAVSAVTGIGDYGQFYSTNITGAATMSRTKGTIEVTNDGKIKLKKGQSYHVTVRGVYNQTSPTNVYGDVSYIEYITGQSIHVNVDKSITDSQYFEISYDLYKLSNDSDYYVFLSMNGGTVNDLFIEIHAIGSVGVGGSGGGGGTEYDAGWGIQILNNVISVNPSIIPVVTGFATKEELQDGLELVTGLIPDISDYATHDEVFESSVTAIQMVTGLIPDAQVQSDWTETDNMDPAYILNKPSEKTLVPGDGISITTDGMSVIISASVTGTPVVTGYVTDEELQDAIELVTGLIPTDYATDEDIQDAVEVVTGLIPDVSNLATKAELQDDLELVTGLIPTDYASDEELQDAIELVTGLIPNYTAGDYISIENNEISVTGTEDLTMKNLTAGEGISITESGDNIVISANVTGSPVVTGYVTDEELQDAVEFVTGLIPDTSDLTTKAELQDGLELVTGLIPTVQLNGDDQVTAINNYPLAGGGGGASYTAGDNIDITNDVISVTGTEDLTLMNLTAGEGISITTDVSGNVEIACTGGGTSYTAGDGIDITDDVISVDDTVVTTAVTSLDFPNMGFKIDNGGQAYKYGGEYSSVTKANEAQFWEPNQFVINDVDGIERIAYTSSNLPENTEVVCLSLNNDTLYTGSNGSIDFTVISEEDWPELYRITCYGLNPIPSTVTFVYDTFAEEAYATETYVTGLIPDVSNLATKVELQDGIELVTGLIPNTSDFITYSASGVELINSNFKIDPNGQAYKNESTTATITPTGTYSGGETTTFNMADLQRTAYTSNITNGYVILNGTDINIRIENTDGSFDLSNVSDSEWNNATELIVGSYWPVQEAVISYTGTTKEYVPYVTETELIEAVSAVTGMMPKLADINTAGITDIQMVTALPANPVSSILYIIPEA